MSKKRWARAMAEHDEILRILTSRDTDALASVLRAHLQNKPETVKEWGDASASNGDSG